MLTISANSLAGEAVGYRFYRQFMLVDAKGTRTNTWMADAGRELGRILGYPPTLPETVDEAEETDDVANLVGKAFDFVAGYENPPDYDARFTVKRILGPVDPGVFLDEDAFGSSVEEDIL